MPAAYTCIDTIYVSGKLGQGGKHTFISKNIEASPFVYLQSEALTAFCTLK